MACKLSISPRELLPYCAVLLVGYSVVHPSRDIREVRALRAEFDTLRSDNAKLRDQFLQTLQFIRNLDITQFAQVSEADGTGGGGESTPAAVSVDGGRFMRAHGLDGISVGADWWLVGDCSPWGVIESAYRGGFVADGCRYTFYGGSRRLESVHD